jgi:hypothetical protein
MTLFSTFAEVLRKTAWFLKSLVTNAGTLMPKIND